jgi:hypothetical protein
MPCGCIPMRIALLGHSIGGYLPPRVAAFEPRIATCVADVSDDDEWNRIAFEWIKTDRTPVVDLDGRWKFGAGTPRDILRNTAQYDLSECVKNIRCHMPGTKAERDHMFPGQPGAARVLLARQQPDKPAEAQPGLECVGGGERCTEQDQKAVEEAMVLDQIARHH